MTYEYHSIGLVHQGDRPTRVAIRYVGANKKIEWLTLDEHEALGAAKALIDAVLDVQRSNSLAISEANRR